MTTRESTKRALVWMLLVTLTGCTTTRTADSGGGSGEPVVAVGDRVRVVTHDGRKLEFTVDKVEDRVLIGHSGSTGTSRVSLPEDVRLPFDEIARIEVKEFDGWKTAGLVAGTVTALWLIIGLILVAAGPALIL